MKQDPQIVLVTILLVGSVVSFFVIKRVLLSFCQKKLETAEKSEWHTVCKRNFHFSWFFSREVVFSRNDS